MGGIEFKNTLFLYDENKWNKDASAKKSKQAIMLCLISAFLFIASLFLISMVLTMFGIKPNVFSMIAFFLMFFLLVVLFATLIIKLYSKIYDGYANLYTLLDWVSNLNDFETIYANENILFVSRNRDGNESFGIKGLKYRFKIDDDFLCISMDENLSGNIKAEIDVCNYPLVSISLRNNF